MRSMQALAAALLCAAWLTPTAASAQGASAGTARSGDPAVSRLCSEHFPAASQRYGVPVDILRAVTLVESGRALGDGSRGPWPWALNFNRTRDDGSPESYMPPTREEALRLLARAPRSVDIGCAQINARWHAEHFPGEALAMMLEPYNNIQYAAWHLRGLYDRYGSWAEAVARYHSHTPHRMSEYAGRVARVLAQR